MPTGQVPEKPAVDLTPSLVARLREGDSAAGKLLDEVYRQKRGWVQVGSVQGHIELARWCRRNGLLRAASRELDA